jgi:hypothetical protein
MITFMNVERALKIIPKDAKLTAETKAGYFGNAWHIVARCPDGYERTVTSFATEGAGQAARWLRKFDQEREADAIERVARRLYLASGGDEAYYPWPCNGAPRWRRLAKEVLDELGLIV